MRSRALVFVLAIVMAWMGLTAQEQAVVACSESLAEQSLALGGAAARGDGSLDDHHLDDLPFQLLADLIGLLGPGESLAPPGVAVRPAAHRAGGWNAPDLDSLHRPPIARA